MTTAYLHHQDDPPPRRPRRLRSFVRRLFGFFDPWKALWSLKSHNAALSALATDEGKKELDRLILFEAIVAARLHSATELLAEKRIEELIKRAGLPANTIDAQTANDINRATEKEGFVKKLWDKCVSVANNKAKGWVKGLFGGDKDSDEADD